MLKLVLMCGCETKSTSDKVKFTLNILNKKLLREGTSNLENGEQNHS
jgi:hypothetical protein